MVTFATFQETALSLPETTEEPHFEKTSFRVKKKIFATYDNKTNQVCIKLSEIDQNVFCLMSQSSIYPVDNKWGKQGWTIIELNKVNNDLFIDALSSAYCQVAPKKLGEQIRPNEKG
jgi:predicted DNA-binding protein (MmcQ/YjbR family)